MVILVVAKHPQQWTKEEVAAWLRWCGEEYSIETVPADKFDMNGKDNTVSSLFCYQRNWNLKKKFKTNLHFKIKAIYGRTVYSEKRKECPFVGVFLWIRKLWIVLMQIFAGPYFNIQLRN